MNVSDDTKLFLRSVLVSCPGMRQSRVMKEYHQTTGDRLEFSKYGYRNLYDFLIALEGEVTRLEFSPKFEENLVYAVLDKTKYASQHAIKYAKKVCTGMKSKSPEEILSWKKGKGTSSMPPQPVVTYDKKSSHKRNNNPKRMNVTKIEPKPKELAPTVSEWAALRKLLPEANGLFTLSIRNIGVNLKRDKFDERALYVHFTPYNIVQPSIKNSMVNSKAVSFISFPSYFTAYRAWKEKDKSIIMGNRIGVEPAGGNLKASTDIHMVIVIQIPTGILMSSFVTLFARFPGLICIDPRPREHCAIIKYSSLESAKKACAQVTNVTINGNKFPISVQILDERPSMPFGAVTSSLLSKSVENKSDNTSKAESPTTEVMSNIAAKPASSMSSDSQRATPVESDTKDDVDLCNLRACGFCINYQQYFQMFQITCRKKPKTLETIPDEIQLLVTHQIDPIRFWGWLMSDNNESVKKLSEIEQSLASSVVKFQSPHVLPKQGHRGAALYKEDGKESWYRCYVLSSDSEADNIEVYYCDYGNSAVIPRDFFRSTYNDAWSLPPQAVPFKMYGFELKISQNKKNTERFNLGDGQVLKATVIKSSLYSQPHVIEIKDVSYVSLNSSIIDDKIIGIWCVPTGSTSVEGDIVDHCGDNIDLGNDGDQVCNHVEDNIEEKLPAPIPDAIIEENKEPDTAPYQEEKSVMDSLFDYDNEDLVLGLLAESHNPNLLYLKLGDVSQFALLQIALDKAELTYPKNLDKGITLLLSENAQRRRVLTLQVLSAFGKVKVLQVDYGIIQWVAVNDLYHLDKDLQDAPFQARPSSLAGIDCKEKMEEAISYLKNKTKIVIKTNVIHEFSSGKISVELFDLNTSKSINKEMIEKGLATRVVNEYELTDTDEELSPNMIPLPVKELNTHIPQTGLLPFPDKTSAPPIFPAITPIATEIEILINAMQLGQTPQEAASSVASWNSQPINPFQIDQVQNNILPTCPNVPKLMDVTTWLQKSPIKDGHSNGSETYSDIERNLDNEEPLCVENDIYVPNNVKDQGKSFHGDRNRSNVSEQTVGKELSEYGAGSNCTNEHQITNNNGSSSTVNASVVSDNGSGTFDNGSSISKEVIKDSAYPQPDIVASNKINNMEIDQGICIDGRKIKIGEDNEILNVGKDNRLCMNEVDEIRQKWVLEKANLIKTKEKLEHLMNIPIEDLTNYYRFIRKEKLQVKLRIKQTQKSASKLESEYQSIIQETNHILSLI